jgi:hypothetical protein
LSGKKAAGSRRACARWRVGTGKHAQGPAGRVGIVGQQDDDGVPFASGIDPTVWHAPRNCLADRGITSLQEHIGGNFGNPCRSCPQTLDEHVDVSSGEPRCIAGRGRPR